MTELSCIVFVVPRFHTNLYFATEALVAAGIRVAIWCSDAVALEDHSVVVPEIVTGSEAAFGPVSRRLAALAPDLIVLRETGELSRSTGWAARLQGRTLVAYDQKPYRRAPRSTFVALRERLRGKPSHRMTPVPGLPGDGRTADPAATYLPWPVGIGPDVDKREYAPGGRARILCVGKLSQPRKNHVTLLDALERLSAAHDFTVTLAGSTGAGVRDGSDTNVERVTARAGSLALAGRVEMRKDVPFRDMAALYRSHDICVLPAAKEPLGSAPVEAMGWGVVPVISSDCGSAGYIAGSDAGRIVPPGDAVALASALEPLLASRTRLDAAGAATLDLVRRELSPEVFVARLRALHERLAAGRG